MTTWLHFLEQHFHGCTCDEVKENGGSLVNRGNCPLHPLRDEFVRQYEGLTSTSLTMKGRE